MPKALFSSLSFPISIPSNKIEPPSFSKEPLIRLKRVDFPHPLAPKIATNSLSLTVKLKLLTITVPEGLMITVFFTTLLSVALRRCWL